LFEVADLEETIQPINDNQILLEKEQLLKRKIQTASSLTVVFT